MMPSPFEKVMPVATLKLFDDDPYRSGFTAQVLSCISAGDLWDVVLNQTCFYATSGGQPNDLGLLGGKQVLGVREDESDGTIIHTVSGALSGEVIGEVDMVRRLDHSQQHTGQHLLSAALERLYDAETLSWHLGSESCTVDFAIESLSPEQIERIELECNRIIREHLPVVTHSVDQAGLDAMPLRKPPKVTENIRIVEISGYDWSPCGGTHVRNTGELGLLKVKSVEKYKRTSRVEMLVGTRALRDYMNLDSMTRELCRSLSIAVTDLPKYVERSQEETAGLRKLMKVMQERLLEIEAAELVAQGQRVGQARLVRLTLGGRPLEEVKFLAAKVAGHSNTVAIFGTRGAIPQIVLHRSIDLRLDMGAVIRQVLPLIDGRGGGSPVNAQGGGSRPDALESALDQAVSRITEALT